MLYPFQAGRCQAFLKSNSFNPLGKSIGSKLLFHFTGTWIFSLPKSSQAIPSPPPGSFQDAPSHTHPPSPELPMTVGEGPGLSSQTGLQLRVAWVDPPSPAQLQATRRLRPLAQAGAVHGSKLSLASLWKSGLFMF